MPKFNLKRFTLKRKVPVNEASTWSSRQLKRFSLWQLLSFALVCGLIGSYLIWHSFAVVVCACGGGGSPTATITANASPIPYNSIPTLTYSANLVTSCSINGKAVSLAAGHPPYTAPAITSNTTYTLSCSGSYGTASASAIVAVNPPPPPTATIDAAQDPIPYGSRPTVIYSVNNASSCNINATSVSITNSENSYTAAAITANTTYTLSCSGPGGTVKASAIVHVVAPSPNQPTATIDANDNPISYDTSPTLIYSATNANSCSINSKTVSLAAGDNSYTAPAITKDTTYTLSCSGSGGVVKAAAIVAVDPPDTANSDNSDQSGQSSDNGSTDQSADNSDSLNSTDPLANDSTQPDSVSQGGTAQMNNQPANPATRGGTLQPSHAKRSSPLKWPAVILIIAVATYLLLGSGVLGDSFRLPPFKKKAALATITPPTVQTPAPQTPAPQTPAPQTPAHQTEQEPTDYKIE